jgi:hypothetical protein
MAPLNSTRLAWSIAIASLALWATSVPLTWGQAAAGADSDAAADQPPCITLPTPVAPITPALAAIPTPLSASEPSTGGGTFHLCGADDSTARAIEQLVGGRSFSTSLSSRGDGCADLTVRPADAVISGNSRAASNVSVSLGSGQNLSIQIVSEGGATHVSIGPGH